MSVNASSFKAALPEFASVDDAIVERWLAEATRHHNITQWGLKSDDGLIYLTAHLLASFAQGGFDEPGAGPVTSEREGQVAVSYKVSSVFTEDEFGSTKYGRRYASIRKTVFTTRCT